MQSGKYLTISAAIVFILLNTFMETESLTLISKVEAFHPKGFRISIEDQPGIQFAAFHVSINKEILPHEVGNFSEEILHANNGWWTYENLDTLITVGDVIYYWVFIMENRIGLIKHDSYKIKELKNRPSRRPYYVQNHVEVETTASSAPVAPGQTSYNCQTTLLNVTRNFMAIQTELEHLRKLNEELNKFAGSFPDAKILTISGRLPHGDARSISAFIVREKLGLEPDIVRATRMTDGSIDVEVSTVLEKLEILDVARRDLQNSNNIVIS